MYKYNISHKNYIDLLKTVSGLIPLSDLKCSNLYDYLTLQVITFLCGLFLLIYMSLSLYTNKVLTFITAISLGVSLLLFILPIINTIYILWKYKNYLTDLTIQIKDQGLYYTNNNYSVDYYFDMLSNIKISGGDIYIKLNNSQKELLLPKTIFEQNETYTVYEYISNKIEHNQYDNKTVQDGDNTNYKTNLH